MIVDVEINNVSVGYGEPYIVARYSHESNSLWYYGRWNNKQDADRVAKQIDGIVLKEEQR